MFVRLFLGLVAGAHALLLISSASPISAAMLLSGLIILAGLRCFHVLFGMLAGMLLVSARLVAFDDDRIAPELVGDSLVVTCSVVGFPIERDTSSRFDARCTGSVRLPERVRLSWQTAPVSLLPGDRWQLEVRLRRPSGLMNPGGFE